VVQAQVQGGIGDMAGHVAPAQVEHLSTFGQAYTDCAL
jgi:hypothetical protein